MKKLTAIGCLIFLFGFTVPDNFILELNQKLELFNKQNPINNFYLVFSQDKYFSGDTVYFSAYSFNENFQSVRERRILVLTLSDHQGNIKFESNFRISEGRSFNQFTLPNDLAPGFYQASVYSSSDSGFSLCVFTKELMVVGKNKIMPAESDSIPIVNFFSEGGHLVANLKNHIVVKSFMKGRGIIKDENGNSVSDFQISDKGFADVYFTPEPEKKYYAQVEAYKSPLKESISGGCTLNVVERNDSVYIVSYVTSQSGFHNRPLYLVVANQKRISYSQRLDLSSSPTFRQILMRKDFPKGLSQISVIDEDGTTIGRRLFLNAYTTTKVNAITNKQRYQQRELVDVAISLHDSNYNLPIEGDFSVSVQKKNFLNEGDSIHSFVADVFMASCPNIRSNVINNEQRALVSTDAVLVDWKKVLAAKGDAALPIADFGLLKVKGKAFYKDSGKPVPDSTLVIGFLQNSMIGYETHTGRDGMFEMPFLYDFFDQEDFFYLMESNGKKLAKPYSIILDKSIRRILFSRPSKVAEMPDDYGSFIYKKRIIDKSYGYFSKEKEKKISYYNLNEKIEDEVMGADLTVSVQDYVVFPSMEELIKEVIPFLEYRKYRNDSTLRLNIKSGGNYVRAKEEPLFVIDGVLTKNKAFFMKLKPLDIIKVKIVNDQNKLTQLGVMGRNGIVLVETKKGLSSVVSQNSTMLKIEGLSKPKPFFVTTYSKGEQSRVPDVRSLLFWAPQLKVNSNGKSSFQFYTSDDTGLWEVRIKGMTKGGDPFETKIIIEVGYNGQ